MAERRKVARTVATRAGTVCKFGYACKHGSRCRGVHGSDETALFKARELRVTDLERTAGCAYCRAGICRFGDSCRGQTATRAATRGAEMCAKGVSALVLPHPRIKLRKRGRRRPRGKPPERSRQERSEANRAKPKNARFPDSWPPRREHRASRDSESSGDEEQAPREDQPGSHQCCSEDPVCRSEASKQFCGLWFCDLHLPNMQTEHRASVSEMALQGREAMRANWDRITSWTARCSTWGLDAATSGWTNLQHGQLTRASAGSLIALLFAIGWFTAAAAASVVAIVLPALHAAQQQRAKLQDREARTEAARRMHATLSRGTIPSESDCLRLVCEWRHRVTLSWQSHRASDRGDCCERGWSEGEMDALVKEIVQAGGGLGRHDPIPDRYRQIFENEIQLDGLSSESDQDY